MTQKFIYEGSLVLDFVLNSLIFLDLYLTLKNPFTERQSRTKIYYSVATGFLLFMVGTYIYFKP